MKMQVFGAFAVLLFVVGAVSVNAQAADFQMRINVPFDFAVGNEILPEGYYLVKTNYGCVTLIGPHGSAFVSTLPTAERGGENAYALAFHRINNEYFLAAIWTGDGLHGRKLFASKREREITAQVGAPVLRILTASAR